MVKLSHDAIVAQLEAHGLTHRSVQVHTEGDYLPADADWNNKDIQHLNHVHAWADDVTAIIEPDLQATVSLQQVLGVTAPVVIVHYDSGPNRQSHFYTILVWTIVTDIEFIEVTPTRTRVVSTYTVLAKPVWMLAFPLIKFLLRRNNRQLMSEDVPLRERRGLLRRWGYTFRGDEKSTRDIRDSINIHRDNVVPPELASAPGTHLETVPISSIDEERWTFVGRNDHLGLKLTREGEQLLAFDRMCPHEGADLDAVQYIDGCLKCPWHGRRIAPRAALELNGTNQRADTEYHRITVAGEEIVVAIAPRGTE